MTRGCVSEAKDTGKGRQTRKGDRTKDMVRKIRNGRESYHRRRTAQRLKIRREREDWELEGPIRRCH